MKLKQGVLIAIIMCGNNEIGWIYSEISKLNLKKINIF